MSSAAIMVSDVPVRIDVKRVEAEKVVPTHFSIVCSVGSRHTSKKLVFSKAAARVAYLSFDEVGINDVNLDPNIRRAIMDVFKSSMEEVMASDLPGERAQCDRIISHRPAITVKMLREGLVRMQKISLSFVERRDYVPAHLLFCWAKLPWMGLVQIFSINEARSYLKTKRYEGMISDEQEEVFQAIVNGSVEKLPEKTTPYDVARNFCDDLAKGLGPGQAYACRKFAEIMRRLDQGYVPTIDFAPCRCGQHLWLRMAGVDACLVPHKRYAIELVDSLIYRECVEDGDKDRLLAMISRSTIPEQLSPLVLLFKLFYFLAKSQWLSSCRTDESV